MRLTTRGLCVLAGLAAVAAATLGANLAPADWFAPQFVRHTVTR